MIVRLGPPRSRSARHRGLASGSEPPILGRHGSLRNKLTMKSKTVPPADISSGIPRPNFSAIAPPKDGARSRR